MHNLGYLPHIVLILSAAVFIVALFKRLNLSPVLGYLVAGAAIGEYGFGYVHSKDVEIFAEFGVVFLLFAIGIELTLERLMSMRSHVFGFGTLQVLFTGAVVSIVAYYFGLKIETAIVIGGALALSSTAIVLGVLADSGRQASQVGRLSLAVLLLQDFAVVPLLVLVPLLAGEHHNIGTLLATASGRALIAMLVIFFAGRIVLRPLFKLIASTNSEELFIAATLFIVLGASLATEYLGLSLALGAFIAGLLVAETQYHHQVEESIKPFKGLLLSLFFMTVGMTIDLRMVWNNLALILALSAGLLVVKSTIIIALCRLFRFNMGTSLHAGLVLAQGGEFAFILFGLANQQDLISDTTAQILLLVVTLTMALTPLLSLIGIRLADRFDKPEITNQESHNEMADLDRYIIICGFGRVGKMVARMLEHRQVNYVILDINSQRVTEGRKEGFPLYRGDISRLEVLEQVGLERAIALIITTDNINVIEKTVRIIRNKYTDLPVIVRSEDLRRSEKLKTAGASVIVPETYETGLQLGGALLKSIGMSTFDISKLKNQFRAGEYAWAKDIVIEPEQPHSEPMTIDDTTLPHVLAAELKQDGFGEVGMDEVERGGSQ